MVTALDRKLVRDLRWIWAQALAIALVLACGIMVLVLSAGTERSLSKTRAAYYERQCFADVFAAATRAPAGLMERIAAIEGVALAEGRIGFDAILDLEGLEEPASARVLSLPALNVPLLRAGRLPDPLDPDEVLLAEPFAQANGLRPGDRFRAIVGGRMHDLVVAGHVLSPEYVYTIAPGTMMPDDRRFGLIWMNEEAAAARDLDGAFNEVVLSLSRDADEAAVIEALDLLLARMAARAPMAATGRCRTPSSEARWSSCGRWAPFSRCCARRQRSTSCTCPSMPRRCRRCPTISSGRRRWRGS